MQGQGRCRGGEVATGRGLRAPVGGPGDAGHRRVLHRGTDPVPPAGCVPAPAAPCGRGLRAPHCPGGPACPGHRAPVVGELQGLQPHGPVRPDSWLTGMARTGDPSARGSPPPEPFPQGWDGTGRGPGRERVSWTRWSPPLPALRSGARPAGRAAWHGAPRETGQHAAHGRTVALVDTVSPWAAAPRGRARHSLSLAGPDRTARGTALPTAQAAHPSLVREPTQEQGTPEARGAFSPNKVAASDALRLNWDSRNLGPNVDMPVMSVASVAPARHSRTNAGFFRRSQVELQGRPWGGERSAWAGPEAASLPTEPSEPVLRGCAGGCQRGGVAHTRSGNREGA